jgi:hypothetical protein
MANFLESQMDPFGLNNFTNAASNIVPSNSNFSNSGSWINPDGGMFDYGKGMFVNTPYGQDSNNYTGMSNYGKSSQSSGGIGFMDILGAGMQLFGAMQQSKLAKQQLALQKQAYQDQYGLASTNLANQKSTLENSMRRLTESGAAQEYKPMGTDWSSMGDYYTQHENRAKQEGQQAVDTLGLREAPESQIA